MVKGGEQQGETQTHDAEGRTLLCAICVAALTTSILSGAHNHCFSFYNLH